MVPSGLRASWDLPVDDLLSHPVLATHQTPLCRLNSFHQDRYAPLLPSYGNGGRRARSSRQIVHEEDAHGRRRNRTVRAVPPHDVPRNRLTYFVALNLYDSATVLPALIRALHSLLTSLGPTRFHISIYENGSKDDTPVQLFLLAKLLRQLGAGYTIISDPQREAGWVQGSRISGLAGVRNRVMQPVYDAPRGTWDRVLFLNDVHLCQAEVLEILLQHEVQGADMSCGMDFKELRIPEFEASGYPLLFYDLWVARDMQGLPFYEIKQPGGHWTLPSPVMPLSDSRFRYDSLLPTQVYSCFNGITVLDAALFEAPHSLRFRADISGTDEHSECFLLCSDIWKALSPQQLDGSPNPHARPGRGARIQIVPRASVGYTAGEYERARKDRNTTAFEVDGEERRRRNRDELIEWRRWPPRLVTTYPYGQWENQISIPPF
ncbi:glycosyltransferase family 69 protein [Rhodotorula paludigena]|uniref:glycosyltransferase family 69 protein n=1 Tax=Rhodotorula paludigena TaxID=86838 RepID=UPI0031765CCA